MYYNLKEFGQSIKAIRRKLNLNREDVAQLVYISIDGLRRIEHGLVIPKIETLDRLSFAYGIDIMKLFMDFRDTLFDFCLNKLFELKFYNKIDSYETVLAEFDQRSCQYASYSKEMLLKKREQFSIAYVVGKIVYVDKKMVDHDKLNVLFESLYIDEIVFYWHHVILSDYIEMYILQLLIDANYECANFTHDELKSILNKNLFLTFQRQNYYSNHTNMFCREWEKGFIENY